MSEQAYTPRKCTKHDPYWETVYANCMACRAEKAEQQLQAIQATVGDTEFALRARVAELEQRNTELEGDFLIASEQRKAERQQLATVTAERDEARKSKNDCVIDLYRKLDTKDEQLASLTLTWTTEQPTSPGLYGFKPDGRAPRVVRVTEKTIQSLYGIGAQWCGPILLPSLEGSAH